MGTEVKVAVLPLCDLCQFKGVKPVPKAEYDAKTKSGPWANLCEACFERYTWGVLGTGKGQRLVLEEDPDAEPCDAPSVHGEDRCPAHLKAVDK